VIISNVIYNQRQQDATGVQEFEYGNMGEMIRNRHTYIVPNSEPFTLTTEWEYDSWNRIKQIIYPDNETVTYTYNLGGLLKRVEGIKPSIGQTIYIDNIEYDQFEQRTAVHNGNETRTYYTYDPDMRRMTHLITENPNGELLNLEYTYDPAGNITMIENTGINPYVQNYTYDDNYQLTYAHGDWTDPNVTLNYELGLSYSPSGSILTKTLSGIRHDDGGQSIATLDYDNSYTYNISNNPYGVSQITDGISGQTNNFDWDSKGNMIYHKNDDNGERRLCWTEDNRIQAMSDRRNGAWYNYDATGERNLKLTGQTMHVNQNGQDYYTPIFDQQTLYANPLITINDRGYTKHYFEEGRRICSKIGSGDLLDINTLVPHMETPYEEQQNIQREGLERTFRACMELTPEIATHNLHEKVVQPYEGPMNPEEPSFYYHSDHLGSASFLTDRDGYETQQLVYLPFGEDWVDMKYNTSQYDTPYKFNGKEKDEETGYNNYGARYYYDWASIWLSVDPMSDKYPHVTSYNYCANNPVMLVDPDGRDIELTFYKGKNNESSKKEFENIVNKGLEGQFEMYYTKGKNGGSNMRLRATKGGGDISKMSSEAQAFYKELYSMTENHNVTAVINVKYGASDVALGNYKNNTIDIADIMQFDDLGKGASTKQGKLTHELVEQFGKAKSGFKKGSDLGYEGNHKRGIAAENRVNGSIRGKESYTPRGSRYSVSHTDKKGNISTYSYSTKNPIIKLTKN